MSDVSVGLGGLMQFVDARVRAPRLVATERAGALIAICAMTLSPIAAGEGLAGFVSPITSIFSVPAPFKAPVVNLARVSLEEN